MSPVKIRRLILTLSLFILAFIIWIMLSSRISKAKEDYRGSDIEKMFNSHRQE